MRNGQVSAVLLVAALSLGGCASADPTPSPTASPSPSETSTPIPDSELEGTLRIVDGGPITGAMGTTTVSPDGRPLTYTVAAGDSADLIRKRFDIWWDQLADDQGARLAKYPEIFVDQVLTFTGSKVALSEELP